MSVTFDSRILGAMLRSGPKEEGSHPFKYSKQSFEPGDVSEKAAGKARRPSIPLSHEFLGKIDTSQAPAEAADRPTTVRVQLPGRVLSEPHPYNRTEHAFGLHFGGKRQFLKQSNIQL